MEISQGESSLISENSTTRDVISFSIRNPTEQKAICKNAATKTEAATHD